MKLDSVGAGGRAIAATLPSTHHERAGVLARQSSHDEGADKRTPGGKPRTSTLVFAGGVAGASVLALGLWMAHAWIAKASATELLSGALILIGAGTVGWAVATSLFLSDRVDRTNEDVALALDRVANGSLDSRLPATRGLGPQAQLTAAATAALNRMRSWVAAVRGASSAVDEGVDVLGQAVRKLQQANDSPAAAVEHIVREARALTAWAEEHGVLTQRAVTLSAHVAQSHRETADFTERVQEAVQQVGRSLTDAAARTGELRPILGRQSEHAAQATAQASELSGLLRDVNRSARQFKLLSLNAAMEAARASEHGLAAGTPESMGGGGGGGSEFRVVALEVRRLAMLLADTSDKLLRASDATLESLEVVRVATVEGHERVTAASEAVSLGMAAAEAAASVLAERRGDDAAILEAAAELAILTSAIRERVINSGKSSTELATKGIALSAALAECDAAAAELAQAVGRVRALAADAGEVACAFTGGGSA
ncbi:MAG: hypothetical protein ACT4R6_06040 [Gemmatimonadaceae bacterium]